MGTFKSVGRWAAIVAGMFTGVACSAGDGSAPLDEADRPVTQAEKIDYVLTRLGFDPSAAVVDAEYSIVEEDILIWHKDLDAYVDYFENTAKSYIPDVGTVGQDGRPSEITLSNVIFNVNSIKVVFEPNVSAKWVLAFRRAAAEWSSAYVDGVGTKVSIDASNKLTNSTWTITIRGGNFAIPAAASYPAPGLLGFLAPGSVIQTGTNWDTDPQSRLDAIALHEIGHTLGFEHPTHGPHIPGTETWTRSGDPRCEFIGETGTYETVMCRGPSPFTMFLQDDDIRATQELYPDPRPFDLNAWDPNNQLCHWLYPCGTGEGHCTDKIHCAGFLVCLSTLASERLYGAPPGGRVCGPSSLVRGESGAGQCPTTASSDRCISVDCPCGVGAGDCDNDKECSTGLVCGEDNGPGVGQGITYDICVHPRPPGCAPMDKRNQDSELCTPDCPCSIGEGDCDTDADCIGELVCAQNAGSAFIMRPDWGICVRPEQESAVDNMPPDPNCDNGVASGDVCCHERCGTCGGTGCSGRTSGGTDACCTGRIRDNAHSCSQYAAPCVMD